MKPIHALLLACLSFSTLAAAPQWANGITEAIDDATLSSSIIGIVRGRPFSEGARVKKGDLIMQLDNRLEELEVARKKLIRNHAKSDLERAKALAARSDVSISKEEIEKKEAEFEVASADYELSVEVLNRRQVIAPFNGIIVDYFLKVGEGCHELQPLVRIVDPSRCHLVTYVDARVGHALKGGDTAQLEVESGRASVAVTGKIDFVSPVADPASGLMKIKIAFENDGRIRPGVAGKMLLPEETNAN